MDYLYHVGDKVRVIERFEPRRQYYMRSGPKANVMYQDTGSEVVPPRSTRQGQIVTISSIDNFYRYRIAEDKGNHPWTDEMFSGLADQNECFCTSLL